MTQDFLPMSKDESLWRWRCTADDCPEQVYDSETALDALLDAEECIAVGALKVVIERIDERYERT